MSLNIHKLLNSDKKEFEDLLRKLFQESLDDATKELDVKYKFNQKLYEAIEFTLKKLTDEESLFSRMLYSSFGIGEQKNKRRRHLILLGSQLKIEISKLERDIQRVNYYYKNISSSTNTLKVLRERFSQNIYTIDDNKLLYKYNQYLKKIYLITDEVNRTVRELDLKSIYLESTLEKYKVLLLKIPRYREIKSEKYLEYKK